MTAHTHDRKMVFLHCKGCSPQLSLQLPDLPKGGVLLIKKRIHPPGQLPQSDLLSINELTDVVATLAFSKYAK